MKQVAMSETELPGNGHSDEAGANGGASRRRKRVVAREVESADAGDSHAGIDDALLPTTIPAGDSDFVIHAPDAGQAIGPAPEHDPTPVLDPTLLGRRHRRHRHQRIYRWTQALTMLCGLASAASVICTMVDEPLVGLMIAAPAALLGVVAVFLSTLTSLSERWRGWAVAALVFALAALGLTWLHAVVTGHEGEDAPPPLRKSTT